MRLSKKIHHHSRHSAMTLVEVMIAMAIGVAALGAATWFTFEGLKASFKAMANVENGIQQWGLATKLQIDGKIANASTILLSADQTTWVSGLPVVVPVDNGNFADGLERGKVLVLTKSQLVQGVDTKVITDMIFYYFTGNSLAATGTLKRYPPMAPNTFAVTAPLDVNGAPKSIPQLVSENITTFLGGAGLVQDQVRSVATNGPFAHIGDVNNVSIALIREESTGGAMVTNSNLTEVSFNLR